MDRKYLLDAMTADGRDRDARAATSLTMVRETIDDIDRRLVALLAERLSAIRRASELKDDPSEALVEWRVEEVAANVRRRASQVGFDADAAERIWRAMMQECIEFERSALASRRRSREA